MSEQRRGRGGGEAAGEQQNALAGVRGGATLMRSVSIFLKSGRKTSSKSLSKSASSGMPEPKPKPKRANLLAALAKKTSFSKQELEALCKIYSKLTSTPGTRTAPAILSNGAPAPVQIVEGIDRTIFRELLHNTFDILTEDALIERMFACWDKHSEGALRLEPWITGLDTFLRGSLREKIEFCFRVYDLNGDGFITRDEMFLLFKNCLMKQPGEEDPEEGVRDLSEMALKKLDVDHDGKVSFLDYEATVREEPLLLEAFGQVLPTPESISAFLLTLKTT